MIPASQMRTGMAIRFENQTYKVLAAAYQPGQGKMGGVMHAHLRNLATGTLWEHGFRSDLKIEEAPTERRIFEFLFRNADECTFMDSENYEQIAIPTAVLGEQARLLIPQMKATIELVDSRAVNVILPDVIEVKITDTAPPAHGSQDSTWKPATLENDLHILVPHFVKIGDTIRVSAADLKYMDRAKAQTR